MAILKQYSMTTEVKKYRLSSQIFCQDKLLLFAANLFNELYNAKERLTSYHFWSEWNSQKKIEHGLFREFHEAQYQRKTIHVKFKFCCFFVKSLRS